MSSGAHVQSFEALEHARAAAVLFREEVDQALATIRAELDGFLEWLEHDRLSYWKHEIRRREERVAEARNDLHRCLSATVDPRRQPSCLQEKKVLESAKRAWEESERKLATVKRWLPIARQAVTEFQARGEALATFLAADWPRAIALLDRSIDRLAAYVETRTPALPTSEPLRGDAIAADSTDSESKSNDSVAGPPSDGELPATAPPEETP